MLVKTLETSTNETTELLKNTDIYSSKNSLDWFETYQGVLPCESCESIETTNTLNEYKTFVKFT